MNEEIFVGVNTTVETIEPSFDNERYIKMRLRVCHDGINRLNVNIPLNAIVNAKSSMANIPILAYVSVDDNGNYVFGDHDMHLEVDNNDRVRLIHEELPIGLVPESCNYTIEEYEGRYYVYVDAYIWKKFANYATDILTSHTEVPISAELRVFKYTKDPDTQIPTYTAFAYDAITLLGDNIVPAIEHAAGFIECCSLNVRERFSDMCKELNTILSGDNKAVSKKEDDKVKEKTTATQTEESVPSEETRTIVPEENSQDTPDESKQTEETTKTESAEESVSAEKTETESSEDTGESTVATFALNSMIVSAIESAIKSRRATSGEYIYLIDYDMSKSIVYVSKENGNIYAVPFSITNDGQAVLGDTMTRQKLLYTDADSNTVSAVFATSMKNLIDSAKQAQTFSAEVDSLKSSLAQIEQERKQEAIETVAAEFSDIADVDEFKQLLSTTATIPSVEDFKEKCYAIRGKNMKPTQAATDENAVPGLRIPFTMSTTQHDAGDALSRLVKQYQK